MPGGWKTSRLGTSTCAHSPGSNQQPSTLQAQARSTTLSVKQRQSSQGQQHRSTSARVGFLQRQSFTSASLLVGGGPVRNPRNGEAALAYNAPAPLLLPGDEAILILNAHPRNPGSLVPQVNTGISRIENGAVRASKHPGQELIASSSADPRSLYDGRTKTEFIALLREAIARN